MNRGTSEIHASGKRWTQQRMAICDSLRRRTDHPDAETLLKDVRSRLPELSLQTVYRTLKMFEGTGIALRVTTWKGRVRYDGNVGPHGHFLCEECGAVKDMETDLDEVSPERIKEGYGRVRTCQILLRGVCTACLTTEIESCGATI